MPQEGYWVTNLLDATLAAGGVEFSFPVSDRQVDGGRDWAPRKFPFRNGQSDEDTGGRPRVLRYTIPLFRGVEEGHYPNLFNDLVEFVESDTHRGRATLTDPEFGPLPVRMTGYTWSTQAKSRDGGELQLTFETLGDENFTLLSTEAGGDRAAVDAEADAALVDEALGDADVEPKDTAAKMRGAQVPITEIERLELGLSPTFAANVGLAPGVTITIPTVPAIPQFTTTVTSTSGFGPTTVPDDEVLLYSALVQRFQRQVDNGELVRADAIADAVDTLLARVAVVRGDTTMDSEQQWVVFEATSRLMSSVQRVAAQAFRDAPLVLDHVLTQEMSTLEVAVDLFADTGRTQEIIDLNPGMSPDFLPKGTTLIVPLE